MRFKKTYETTRAIQHHDHAQCLSFSSEINDNTPLSRELSTPLRIDTGTGKIRVESKKELRIRGISSPNYADAMVLAFGYVPSSTTESSIVSMRETADNMYRNAEKRVEMSENPHILLRN
jgi:hypothetical protein